MDTDHRSYIVKRNEPITEEAPNTSTDRSTRHSPGRTLRGYRYFRACPRQASLKSRPHAALFGFSAVSTLSALRPGSH